MKKTFVVTQKRTGEAVPDYWTVYEETLTDDELRADARSLRFLEVGDTMTSRRFDQIITRIA